MVGFEQQRGALEVVGLALGGERLDGAGGAGQQSAGDEREEESSDSGHGRFRHLGAEKVAVYVAFGSVSAPIAADDIVQTPADAEGNSRPPLLVIEPLRAFLDAHGLGEGELRATPIGEGHSNVTYLIERDGSELVLRRPPRPPLPPSAHDVLREARLLRALRDTPARVPEVLAVCEDHSTIGAPFYVMERVEGEVIVASVPPELDTPAERRRIGEQLIDALVEIHGVDWRSIGLEDFGKPTGYLERQLRRFGGLWELNKTREIPAVETVGAWLARAPAEPDADPGDDRPRRLSPRQHDVRAGGARAADGGARLGDGHDRRPAGRHRLPVHDVGAGG